jgi:hypothetical protein
MAKFSGLAAHHIIMPEQTTGKSNKEIQKHFKTRREK